MSSFYAEVCSRGQFCRFGRPQAAAQVGRVRCSPLVSVVLATSVPSVFIFLLAILPLALLAALLAPTHGYEGVDPLDSDAWQGDTATTLLRAAVHRGDGRWRSTIVVESYEIP
jgi:hypothetical protein